ncbi:MAG TPA: hypothetical protein VGR26_15530 [Acidimicrobiales bacterium]|nr:hypothetical protein [Acidimicrobiales bacterium]
MRLARRRSAQAVDKAPMASAPSDEADGATRRRVLRATRIAPADASAEEDASRAGALPVDGSNGASASDDPRSRKGRLRALIDEQVAESRQEAERQAAFELSQSMEPARQQLLLNVPGSSSPEEAEAILASQAAAVLDTPVEVQPETVVDLRNPPSMRAYPPAEKLSNRVLRLADRHWAKGKPRSPAEIVAEQAERNEEEFARRPVGTQRCLALRGSLRCRGVFAYRSDQQADSSLVACPSCGAAHFWDPDAETWLLGSEEALGRGRERKAVTTGT